MEKKCIYCNDLLDIKLHGLTKYCSAKCRNKDYYLKKKSDESKNTIELQSNEKLPETNFRQMDQMNEIKKENNFIEPNKDYYTLYIEEKHKREIDKLHWDYETEKIRESIENLEDSIEERREINREKRENKENGFSVDKLVEAGIKIAGAFVENREKNTKIVQM